MSVGAGPVLKTGGPIERPNQVGGHQKVVASEVMLVFMKHPPLVAERWIA